VSLPGYCITCIFAGRNHRRNGMARVAPGGALDLIARPGGGVVEACPRDSAAKKMPATFMGDAHDRPGRVTGEGMPGLRACRR
jgi:hypothetical protein